MWVAKDDNGVPSVTQRTMDTQTYTQMSYMTVNFSVNVGETIWVWCDDAWDPWQRPNRYPIIRYHNTFDWAIVKKSYAPGFFVTYDNDTRYGCSYHNQTPITSTYEVFRFKCPRLMEVYGVCVYTCGIASVEGSLKITGYYDWDVIKSIKFHGYGYAGGETGIGAIALSGNTCSPFTLTAGQTLTVSIDGELYLVRNEGDFGEYPYPMEDNGMNFLLFYDPLEYKDIHSYLNVKEPYSTISSNRHSYMNIGSLWSGLNLKTQVNILTKRFGCQIAYVDVVYNTLPIDNSRSLSVRFTSAYSGSISQLLFFNLNISTVYVGISTDNNGYPTSTPTWYGCITATGMNSVQLSAPF
jgi:hypothetical protein